MENPDPTVDTDIRPEIAELDQGQVLLMMELLSRVQGLIEGVLTDPDYEGWSPEKIAAYVCDLAWLGLIYGPMQAEDFQDDDWTVEALEAFARGEQEPIEKTVFN